MSGPDRFFEQRMEKADALREMGVDPYANDFKVDTRALDFIRLYHEQDKESLEGSTQIHALAGRVVAVNKMGKAAFIRLQDSSCDEIAPNGEPVGRIQIYLRRDELPEADFAQYKKLDIGDIIGVSGSPMKTRTGELTVHVKSFRLLTKSLRPLPEKWHGLTDVETRYRQRYLDLIANDEARRVFRARSQIIHSMRQFFVSRGFLEVETPMMHPIAGGAAARPFVTHHNTLDAELYLRIAPELYLKRLVVGGFDRVFEINRNFRNEGVSTFHNPEFTMLEFYQAYTTYTELMEIGEDLISGACMELHGTTTVQWCDNEVSLAKPFDRMTMLEAIEKHGGPSQEDSRDPEKARAALEGSGLKTDTMGDGQLVVALFEHFAEAKLIQPTFIYDFPASVSPLSRKRTSDPWFVDRFELFVGGKELANAFSELNDPVDQKQRFESQLEARADGDDEAHQMDEDYVCALEHGMPPTGGFGLGVDRLVMLLTGTASIRDVVLFPQLRIDK